VILNGNALHIPLADQSVQCAITSPPYWGLRDYGTASWIGGDAECDHKPAPTQGNGGQRADRTFTADPPYRNTCGKCGATRQDAQLGLEPTPEEYVANMVAVFREVWRVLRDDGTLWLNLGDSYASQTKGSGGPTPKQASNTGSFYDVRRLDHGLKDKDLCGIPWRVAFALQADGWYLRSDIIWSKPNPMPESVTDRPTKAHEYVFLLTKQARYYYDADAVREEYTKPLDRWGGDTTKETDQTKGDQYAVVERPGRERRPDPAGRNRRTVWSIATQPYSGAHFATFPEALVEPCLLAGTSERGCCPVCGNAWKRVVEGTKYEPEEVEVGIRNVDDSRGDKTRKLSGREYNEQVKRTTTGWLPACEHDAPPIPCTVFDPFSGSGTVGVVAQRFGRRFVGLELSMPYIRLAQERIAKANGYHVGRLL